MCGAPRVQCVSSTQQSGKRGDVAVANHCHGAQAVSSRSSTSSQATGNDLLNLSLPPDSNGGWSIVAGDRWRCPHYEFAESVTRTRGRESCSHPY